LGDDTHKSDWVNWEIDNFFELNKIIVKDKTWKRIRGMKLKGSEEATLPSSLYGKSSKHLTWNPEDLDTWLNANPDA
jgi:hypothetical protein